MVEDEISGSQCTFWCWVLSDGPGGLLGGVCLPVLMHLLVLGAFWRRTSPRRSSSGTCLNAPSGAGCFLTPASGSGVVAPLPRVGAPPAPQAPREAGRHRPYLSTFRRPDAKRHRRPLRHLQPPTSDDVKPKGRHSRLYCRHILVVGAESGPELGVKGASSVESPSRSVR